MGNKPKHQVLQDWWDDMAQKRRAHERIKPTTHKDEYKCTLTSKGEEPKEPVQLELDLEPKEEDDE